MESNAWCPRLTAAMILSGSAVHVKGFGSALVSARKRLMAAWRSATERKTPRFKRRLDSLAKKPSTALSQEHEVGVKWKTKRSCRSSQARNLGMLVGGVVVEDDVDHCRPQTEQHISPRVGVGRKQSKETRDACSASFGSGGSVDKLRHSIAPRERRGSVRPKLRRAAMR